MGKTLEELSREYDYLVLDTSSLFSTDSLIHKSVDLKIRIKRVQDEIDYLTFFNNFLSEGGKLYTTFGILDEITALKVPKSKSKKPGYNEIKKRVQYKAYNNIKIFQNKREELRKKSIKFANNLSISGGILNFVEGDKEVYLDLESQNNFLFGNYNISENDFKLLISSALLALNRGRTCLITNDKSLFRAGNFFRENYALSREVFGVYKRKEPNFFMQ